MFYGSSQFCMSKIELILSSSIMSSLFLLIKPPASTSRFKPETSGVLPLPSPNQQSNHIPSTSIMNSSPPFLFTSYNSLFLSLIFFTSIASNLIFCSACHQTLFFLQWRAIYTMFLLKILHYLHWIKFSSLFPISPTTPLQNLLPLS